MKINPPFLAIVLLRHENIHRRIFSGALKFRALGPPACLHSLKEVRRQTRQQCNSHPMKTMERINQLLSAVILSKHILDHENIHCLISVQALEFQTLVTKYYRERVRSRLRSSKDKRGNNAIGMLWIPWKDPINHLCCDCVQTYLGHEHIHCWILP